MVGMNAPEADGGDGGDAGPVLSEPVNVTLKYHCPDASADTYTQLATITGVSSVGWTQVASAGAIQITCTPPSADLYVEGPDSGIDLYVDDISLQQVQ
jgi:hypothetical protein